MRRLLARLVDLPARTRRRLYRICTAVVPLLVAYGVLAESEAGLWVGLAGAVLAAGEGTLAARHTPRDDRGGR